MEESKGREKYEVGRRERETKHGKYVKRDRIKRKKEETDWTCERKKSVRGRERREKRDNRRRELG